MTPRMFLLALLTVALTACGTSGTASFGGYVPPDPVSEPAPLPAPVMPGQAIVTVDAPQGLTPALALRFPDSTQTPITRAGTHTFADLKPGAYHLTGTNVRLDGFTFTPQFSVSPLEVRSERTVTGSVRYVPLGGRLAVNVQAIPGLSPSVRITGPGTFTRNVTRTGTTVLADLTPGTYTLTAEPRLFNGRNYVPTPHSPEAAVEPGTTGSVGVTYAAVTGTVDLTVTGLPDTEQARVHLSGPGTDLSLQSSTHLPALAPGEYHLTAEPVTSSAGTFIPSQSMQTLALTGEGTLDASILYTRQ